MAGYQVVPSDMSAAQAKVAEAASTVRSHDSSGHLSGAARALPGSTSATLLVELGTSWDDELDGWATRAEGFADRIAAASADARAADQQSGGLFGGLNGSLGAPAPKPGG